MFRLALVGAFCLLLTLQSNSSFAGDFVEDSSSGGAAAQDNGASDSTFDPFSDYSEFEEGSQEEADINFFHNGRFFSLGMLGGYESFTDTLGIIYSPSFQFGFFFEYFFDLKLAMQLAYLTASHSININTGNSTPFTGSANISRFEFDFKYYLNTQNVTRGLAALNPYLILGASSYSRKTNINGSGGEVDDSAFGVQGGVGIEIPIMQNSAFFGVQGTYNYVAFPGQGSPITNQGQSLGLYPNGNIISILGILGMSF